MTAACATQETQATQETKSEAEPFLVRLEDLCRVLGVGKSFISRSMDAGTFPLPAIRLGDKVVRFRKPDIEAFFGAPLSQIMPWIHEPKDEK